jgi:FtsZ-interacting cell division protein ZipA
MTVALSLLGVIVLIIVVAVAFWARRESEIQKDSADWREENDWFPFDEEINDDTSNEYH